MEFESRSCEAYWPLGVRQVLELYPSAFVIEREKEEFGAVNCLKM